MSLAGRIDEDLKTALKAGDSATVSTLRMLKAGMGNLAIQRQKMVLEDSEVQEAARRLIKQHEESIEAYTKAGRSDLAQKEARELAILKAFVPPALEEPELRAIIREVLQELQGAGAPALGAVMKAVMAKAAGRADGKKVNQLVAQMLKGA
ncbi:MAG: GatB/YqeY domain-containing protein [Candidatus Omnitrophica bacterium]|nr:GatB/YqeY domain-containing protein [Candidatus Omnitrophota bacterium]